MQVIEVMTSGDEDEEDEGLGAEERTGLVEAVIDVCRLGGQLGKGGWHSMEDMRMMVMTGLVQRSLIRII